MTATDHAKPPITPENWDDPTAAKHFSKPQTKGWGSLGIGATFLLFAGVLVCFGEVLFTPKPWNLLIGFVTGVAWLVGWRVVTWKDRHGDTVLTRRAIRHVHNKARATGRTHYRSGPGTRDGNWRLPGVLCQTEMTHQVDEDDNDYGMLYTPATGDFAVTFIAEPDGAGLVDDLGAAVDHWEGTARGLCHEPDCVQVQIILGTAADPGFGLQQWLLGKVVEGAPDRSRDISEELAADSPRGASSVDTWVTLTFAGGQAKPPARLAKAWNWLLHRPPLETVQTTSEVDMASSLAARLPVIAQHLSESGGGAVRLATAHDITTAVRIAFDPGCADLVAQAEAEGRPFLMRWGSAGPAVADDHTTHYWSGGCWHRSHEMTDVIGVIRDTTLTPLMDANKQLLRKRVIITLTLHDPAYGAHLANHDASTAKYGIRTSNNPTDDQMRQHKATAATSVHRSEAGAGVVDVALSVTSTIWDPTRPLEDDEVGKRPTLKTVDAVIGGLQAQVQLQLRPCDGYQALAFTRSLPVGLRPELLTNVPAWVGNAL